MYLQIKKEVFTCQPVVNLVNLFYIFLVCILSKVIWECSPVLFGYSLDGILGVGIWMRMAGGSAPNL